MTLQVRKIVQMLQQVPDLPDKGYRGASWLPATLDHLTHFHQAWHSNVIYMAKTM
jgi:hypothetical protein